MAALRFLASAAPAQKEAAREPARRKQRLAKSNEPALAFSVKLSSQAMAVRSGAMKRRMTLGDFLVAYLRKIGVTRVFGIPGDLALRLFFALGRKHRLEIVTFSHEPGVGF